MVGLTCYMVEAGHLVLTWVILYTSIASWRSLNTGWRYDKNQEKKLKNRIGFYKNNHKRVLNIGFLKS